MSLVISTACLSFPLTPVLTPWTYYTYSRCLPFFLCDLLFYFCHWLHADAHALFAASSGLTEFSTTGFGEPQRYNYSLFRFSLQVKYFFILFKGSRGCPTYELQVRNLLFYAQCVSVCVCVCVCVREREMCACVCVRWCVSYGYTGGT